MVIIKNKKGHETDHEIKLQASTKEIGYFLLSDI